MNKCVFRRIKAIETTLTGISFWWFFILILPLNTFGTESYESMEDLAPEWVWAIAFLLLSIVHLYGMLRNRFKIRRLGLLLSTGIWLFVASTLFYDNPATTGTGVYVIVALLSSWLYNKVGEQRNGRE